MKAGAQDYVMKGDLERLARRWSGSCATRPSARPPPPIPRRMMEARYRILSIAPDAIIAMDEALHMAMFDQGAAAVC